MGQPDRLKRLTGAQFIHLKLLRQHCQELRVDGVDAWGGLVVTRTDMRGTVTYAIRALGPGRKPQRPLRALTAEDLENMPGQQAVVLMQLVDLDAIYRTEEES